MGCCSFSPHVQSAKIKVCGWARWAKAGVTECNHKSNTRHAFTQSTQPTPLMSAPQIRGIIWSYSVAKKKYIYIWSLFFFSAGSGQGEGICTRCCVVRLWDGKNILYALLMFATRELINSVILGITVIMIINDNYICKKYTLSVQTVGEM